MASPSRVIAIFGATGQTGRVVVRHILSDRGRGPAATGLNIYVRSLTKLRALFPGIDSEPQVKVFEGSITDTDVVQNCCRGAHITICTLGENENLPTVTILEDAADGILASLRHLKESEVNRQKPKMFLLSSSTFNPRFAAAPPPPPQ